MQAASEPRSETCRRLRVAEVGVAVCAGVAEVVAREEVAVADEEAEVRVHFPARGEINLVSGEVARAVGAHVLAILAGLDGTDGGNSAEFSTKITGDSRIDESTSARFPFQLD